VQAALVLSAAILLFLGVLPGGLLEGALAAAEGIGVEDLGEALGQLP
jgi:hypothetical protein